MEYKDILKCNIVCENIGEYKKVISLLEKRNDIGPHTATNNNSDYNHLRYEDGFGEGAWLAYSRSNNIRKTIPASQVLKSLGSNIFANNLL